MNASDTASRATPSNTKPSPASTPSGHVLAEADLRLVDCLFEAKDTIRSLPDHHGARWTAWMRRACRKAGFDATGVYHILYPLRSGRRPVLPGEILFVRLVVPGDGFEGLSAMLRVIEKLPPEGEFSGENLRFLGLVDTLGRRPLAPEADPAAELPPLAEGLFAAETRKVLESDLLHVDLLSPLRLLLPGGEKHRSMKDRERFCPPGWFATSPKALGHLLSRVRVSGDGQTGERGEGEETVGMAATEAFTKEELEGSGAPVLESDLVWTDMRYNADKKKALGGVTGSLRVRGRLDPDSALRLVLGQYLGAGRNGRFGLGFWSVRELEGTRTVPLVG